MNEAQHTVNAAQQTRRRAMVIPREHGAWGLLFVPLFTGFVAGFAPEYRIWQLLLFTGCAVSLFFLRTPVESLLGIGSVVARTSGERWTALVASTGFGMVASAGLLVLIWKERYSALLVLGAATGCMFVLQAVLRKLGRSTRMISQVVGAIGLTCAAPAAYYIGTGHLDRRAFVLWAANWVFAGNQIHFVQLRIHASRAATFSEKFQRGRSFFIAQLALLPVLFFASLSRDLAPLMIIAFVPAVLRGAHWFIQKPEPLDVKRLGWSEMKHGIAFGILLTIAILYR
jgi:alkylhydroperoxidase family enzyme